MVQSNSHRMRGSLTLSSYESFFCGSWGVGELVAFAWWRMKIVLLIGWILIGGKNLSCDGFHHHVSTRVKMDWSKTTTTIGKEIERKLSSL